MAKRPALEVRPPKNADEFVTGGAAAAPPPVVLQPLAVIAPTVEGQKRGRGRPRKHPAPAAPPPAAKFTKAKRKRGFVVRADGTQLTQLTIYLEASVGEKFRRYCFEHDLKMSDVASQILTKFIVKL